MAKYFQKHDVKEQIKQYLTNKDIKIKDKPLDTQLYLELDYLGESLLQILMGGYGVRYNTTDSLRKRSGSPIQLLSKYLRYYLIVKDIDIKGAHIVAFIKKIKGSDYEISIETLNKLYTYETGGGRDNVLKHLKTFKDYKELTYDELEKELDGERNCCKQTLLGLLNRGSKYGSKKDIAYINTILKALGIEDVSSLKNLGYNNGIIYEDKWLEKYNGIDGVIYRISDGLCQVCGNDYILNDIMNEIMNDHKIILSYENIEKYSKLPMLWVLDDFVMCNHNTYGYIPKEELFNGGFDMMIDSFNDCLDALENFRKYARKGKFKGNATGKAIKEKRYLCSIDLNIKDKEYKKGEIYIFGKDFIKTVGIKRRHFHQVIN